MKLNELKALAGYLKQFSSIKKARRIENNTVELNFGEDTSLFFDMTRSRSTVYRGPSRRPAQDFAAPVDTLLSRFFAHSRIVSVEVPESDRILKITVQPRSLYKNRLSILQFEFTGRHTNAILLDENDIVIEALHHVDISRSYRIVKPGVQLGALPPKQNMKNSNGEFAGEIEEILEKNYHDVLNQKMKNLRNQKRSRILKKMEKIQAALRQIPDEARLVREAERYRNAANIILANLHLIKPYDKELIAKDFEGRETKIDLPKNIKKNRLSEYYFNLARRTKSKSENLHIEKENLLSKLAFYNNILRAIDTASEPCELEMLVPKRGRSMRKKEKLRDGELYWIEGYKIFVGRNSHENIKLLRAARANDIWMHTREIPGSHVIIRTDKQNIPESVLHHAAKLCVDFSTDQPGNYQVDYTKRKFVKIREGSSVEYDKYSTVHILKEGIEIRK
jgi:predicted ribosome quality control (RQC) complex YloA/Tae2 family protein